VFLLEHHGKELLASHGIAVPPGIFVASRADLSASRRPAGGVSGLRGHRGSMR